MACISRCSRRSALNLYPKLFLRGNRVACVYCYKILVIRCVVFFIPCKWDLSPLAYHLCLDLGIESKRRDCDS